MGTFFCLNVYFFGSLSTWTRHAPTYNGSEPRQFLRCRCYRLLQRRNSAIGRGRTTVAVAARPLRRSSAQPAPSAVPKKKNNQKATVNQVFRSAGSPRKSSHEIITSIRVSPSLLPAGGCGAAPAHLRNPKGDSLVHSRCRQKTTAANGVPSLASGWSPVRVSRPSCVIRTLEHNTPFLDRAAQPYSSHSNKSIHSTLSSSRKKVRLASGS